MRTARRRRNSVGGYIHTSVYSSLTKVKSILQDRSGGLTRALQCTIDMQSTIRIVVASQDADPRFFRRHGPNADDSSNINNNPSELYCRQRAPFPSLKGRIYPTASLPPSPLRTHLESSETVRTEYCARLYRVLNRVRFRCLIWPPARLLR